MTSMLEINRSTKNKSTKTNLSFSSMSLLTQSQIISEKNKLFKECIPKKIIIFSQTDAN